MTTSKHRTTARLTALLLCLAFPPTGNAAAPRETGAVAVVGMPVVVPDKRFQDAGRVYRNHMELRISEGMDLLGGDEIYMNPHAAIVVHYLATNECQAVRRTATDPDAQSVDYTVKQLPGLFGAALNFMKEWLFAGARESEQCKGAFRQENLAATRGTCFNQSGKTNDPIPFGIPVLAADRSVLAAGKRPIFVAWRGGAPPFSVVLAEAETGRIVAESRGIHNACSGWLPAVELQPGRYRLTVADANSIREEENSLFVATEAPAVPRELRDAKLPEEARQIYAATWLSVLDGGRWAFEAQQRVAAMDCHSVIVQEWLRHWGGLAPCSHTE